MLKLLWGYILFLFYAALPAQTFYGKIIDGSTSAPLEFANAILLQSADSTFIVGTVSDSLGNFEIKTTQGDYLLEISYLGYQTKTLKIQNENIGTITLLTDTTNTLKEVVIKGSRPIIKMENGGISIDIQNSRLRDMGNATDVLGQLPFVSYKKDQITVFGKGTPLIYINNRLVRDNSELDELNSNQIKKITVITNPGVEYDATVQSVIRIETVKTQGEGLSGSFVARATKDRRFSHYETVNLNYRKDKLDLFGMFRYGKYRDFTYLELGQNTNSNDIQTDVAQKGWQEMWQQYYRTNIGANYTFDKNNSAGVKFQHNGNIQQKFFFQSDFTAYTNKTISKQFNSNINADNNPNSNYLNAYYNGKFVPWLSVKLNIDYASGSGFSGHVSNNFYMDSTEIISTEDRNNYDLYAAKLILTTPLFNSELNYGYEASKTINNQEFAVLSKGESDILYPSDNTSRQLLNAVFFSYSKQIGLFASEIGLRYEHVDFEYFNDGNKDLESSKLYNNWLPEASISYQKNKLQMQLSYRNSTIRPSYYQLRSEVQYDNPYTYESGNPYLKPTMINTLSYILAYSNLQSSVSYNIYKDLILFAPTMLSADIICMVPQNFQDCRDLQVSVSYSPRFGVWQPSLELDLSKYFYSLGNPPQTYNKPVLFFNLKNNFALAQNLNITSEFTYNTRGNLGIDYVYNYFCANLYVSKLLLNKKLQINLGANNLFNLEKQKVETYMSGIYTSIFKNVNTQNIYISMIYNFNKTKNKYKGEQASDELNRL